MLSVLASLSRAVVLVAVAALATSSTSVVTWTAPSPGEDLRPVGSASDQVLVTQNGPRILWVSEVEPVATVMTLGWETTDGDTELAGAMTIETVYRTTGSLSIGEPPKTVSFSLES